MKFRSMILNSCLIVSTGCLGAGYIFAGYWQILPALLVILLFGIMAKKQLRFWSTSSFLLVYIILAAIGVVADLPVGLMILACTFALASWDLIQFEQSIAGNSMLQTRTLLEKHHLRSLALAASAGLLLAFLSLYVHLQLTFGVIVSLVLIAMGCLLYGMQYSVKKRKR
jgi:hypothetical protein